MRPRPASSVAVVGGVVARVVVAWDGGLHDRCRRNRRGHCCNDGWRLSRDRRRRCVAAACDSATGTVEVSRVVGGVVVVGTAVARDVATAVCSDVACAVVGTVLAARSTVAFFVGGSIALPIPPITISATKTPHRR